MTRKLVPVQPRFAARTANTARPPAGTIRVTHVAEVAAVWHVRELEPLRAIEAEHGLAWPAVQSRFEYKGRPEVRVVAVRVLRLPAVHDVPETRRYQGCVSWVELDAAIDVAGASPVCSEQDLRARVETLAGVLGEPEREGLAGG